MELKEIFDKANPTNAVEEIKDAVSNPKEKINYFNDLTHEYIDKALDKTEELVDTILERTGGNKATNDKCFDVIHDFNKSTKEAGKTASQMITNPIGTVELGNEVLHDIYKTSANLGKASNKSIHNKIDETIDEKIENADTKQTLYEINDMYRKFDQKVAEIVDNILDTSKEIGDKIVDPVMNTSALEGDVNKINEATNKLVKESEKIADKGMSESIKENPNALNVLVQILTGQDKEK